jgi:hypothetical protein
VSTTSRITVAPSAILALILLFGCESGTAPDPDPNRVATCAEPGTSHGLATTRPEFWKRADSPHHLTGNFVVQHRLTIEAGALVCATADAQITVSARADRLTAGTLYAVGTAEAPIRFTASNPDAPWGGISLTELFCCAPNPDSNRIAYATIENARVGISARHTIYIEHTHIRQIRGSGVFLSRYGGSLRHSVVDSAALDGGTAVQLTTGTFEETVVRGSGGDGLSLGGGSTGGGNVVLGGRIEGSKGTGLYAAGWRGVSVVRGARPVRITGNNRPAVLNIDVLYAIWPTAADRDSLLGNAVDTLIVYPGGAPDEVVVSAKLPWILRTNEVTLALNRGLGQVLRLEPGASVRFAEHAFNGATLIARGTADKPVTLHGGGILLRGSPGDTSFISHAQLIGIRVVTADNHPLVIDNTIATNGSSAELRSAGSRISSSVFECGPSDGIFGGGSTQSFHPPPAAIVLGAPGVQIENTRVASSTRTAIQIDAGNVVIDGCQVVSNAGDGILVSANLTGVQVHRCDFAQNQGAGIRSLGLSVVSASGNWWGDVAGPTGPNGDGVSGPVDYIPFRTAPNSP